MPPRRAYEKHVASTIQTIPVNFKKRKKHLYRSGSCSGDVEVINCHI